MKSRKSILILALGLVSFGALAQHDQGNQASKNESGQKMDLKFIDENLGIAYGHYIHLKEALVDSQTDEAKMAATKLEVSLDTFDNSKGAKTEASRVVSSTTLDN